MLDEASAARPYKGAQTQQPGEGGWQRLELDAVSPESCEALNDAYGIRTVMCPPLGGRALKLSPKWLPREPAITDPWTVTIAADDRQVELVLPRRLLALILTDLDATLRFELLAEALRPLLLEYALRSAFEALEAALGCRLSVRSVSRGRPQPGDPERVMLACLADLEGAGQTWCILRLYPEQLRDLTSYLGDLAEQTYSRTDVCVPVCLRWANVELTLAELRSLAPGDIVLVDESCRQPGLAVAVIGEHMAVGIELLRNGYRLSGQPIRAAGSALEWGLDRDQFRQAPIAAATTDEISMRLLFEFGRFELERSVAAQLKAGALLDLARPLEEGLDLVVGGARVGRGEVVTIESAIGVRVTRLL